MDNKVTWIEEDDSKCVDQGIVTIHIYIYSVWIIKLRGLSKAKVIILDKEICTIQTNIYSAWIIKLSWSKQMRVSAAIKVCSVRLCLSFIVGRIVSCICVKWYPAHVVLFPGVFCFALCYTCCQFFRIVHIWLPVRMVFSGVLFIKYANIQTNMWIRWMRQTTVIIQLKTFPSRKI